MHTFFWCITKSNIYSDKLFMIIKYCIDFTFLMYHLLYVKLVFCFFLYYVDSFNLHDTTEKTTRYYYRIR